DLDLQPFSAQVTRLIEAMDLLGAPFSTEEKAAVHSSLDHRDAKAAAKLQEVLDRHCLFGVSINPEMRVKVAQGPAKPELVEQGWRVFLVKVQNESGSTAALRAISPNARSLFDSGSANNASDQVLKKSAKANTND